MFPIERTFLFAVLMSMAVAVSAEMKSLSDDDLASVDGQGVGIVLEDFVFSHGHDTSNGNTFRITGVTNSAGESVTINVNQLYIARSGSNYGDVLNPVNLGRLTNPYEIDLIDGADIGLPDESVLQLAAPTKVDAASGYDCLSPTATLGTGECSSRPGEVGFENGERPDMGVELQITEGTDTRNLNVHAQSAVFDGSYLRLWGDENVNKMAASYRLNFYSPQLEISTCDASNEACGESIVMSDFELELALGHSFQPLYIGADATSGGLTIEIEKISHEYYGNIDPVTGLSDGSAQGDQAYAFFNDYYSNPEYRSNFSASDITISGTSLGSARVEGVLIQYLDVKFRDLAP